MRVDKRLETWKAMETILKSGRARSIGVSNYGIHHLEELFAHCSIRPSVNQVLFPPARFQFEFLLRVLSIQSEAHGSGQQPHCDLIPIHLSGQIKNSYYSSVARLLRFLP